MNNGDRISKYCSYGEATYSQTAQQLGIPNTPSATTLERMKYVATEVFDRVREYLGSALTASSFFRSPDLNKNVHGSSTTSQHMKGEAIDMVKASRNKEIFDFITTKLEFDQVIWEYGNESEPAWVHCSKVSYRKNRGMVLRCFLNAEGQPQYIPFDLYPIKK